MTMSAVLTTREVADSISRGEAGVLMHGPTFMANPLACAVATESLRLLKEQDMLSRIAHIESIIKQELQPAKNLDTVSDVRSIGAIGVIETNKPVNVGEFQKLCVERGVWIRPFGRNVYIMPPYIISDEQLQYLIIQMIEIVKIIAE
jgi:adenosylmethionine-8-amino-7-oxononanoate aminotransferase